MSAEEIAREHHEKIGRLEADVHTLTKTVEKLFTKFDEFVQHAAPRPLSLPVILAGIVSALTLLALLFGGVTYIVTSALAPVASTQQRQATELQTMFNTLSATTGAAQLLQKEISVTDNRARANEDTLHWLLFEENLPKQITQMQGDLRLLQSGANDSCGR